MKTFIAIAALLVVSAQAYGGWDRPSGGHGGGWGGHDGGWGEHGGGWGGHDGGWDRPSGWGKKSTARPSSSTTGRPSSSSSRPSSSTASPQPSATLDQLYRASLAEGGRVIVYAGGDTPGQLDYMKDMYEKRFNGTTLDLIVGYSKEQDGRIDNQLATNTLVPDVTQLQTIQDFSRWKAQGVLMNYKPIGWDQVYEEFKDPDGYFTGVFVSAFSNVVSKTALPDNKTWPREANDYLKPEFKDKIIVTYPNDDDAVLFWLKQVVDKYGWSWLENFVKQNPKFVRGTQEPYDAADQNRTPATPAAAGDPANPSNVNAAFVLPEKDPFMSWAQTAAIFKDAKRPAGAKLYMSWLLDMEAQGVAMWTVRKDGPAPAPGLKSIWNYPGQTDPTAFGKWMADRAAVERFRTQVTLYVGEVTGPPSTGYLDRHQSVALPH